MNEYQEDDTETDFDPGVWFPLLCLTLLTIGITLFVRAISS